MPRLRRGGAACGRFVARAGADTETAIKVTRTLFERRILADASRQKSKLSSHAARRLRSAKNAAATRLNVQMSRLQFKPPFRGAVLCSSNPRRTFILFNKIIPARRRQFNSFRSSVFDTFRPGLPLMTRIFLISTLFSRAVRKFFKRTNRNSRTVVSR